MKQTVRVSEHADMRALARAMIMQAVRDMRNPRQPMKQLDAFLFLTGEDFPLWCEVMDAPFLDAFKMLSSGGARMLDRKVSNDK
jgi:hypothetical protein